MDKLTPDSSELEVRRANDKILQFDRAFLVDEEIPGTMFYSKNILVSPSSTNLYDGKWQVLLLFAVLSCSMTMRQVFDENVVCILLLTNE